MKKYLVLAAAAILAIASCAKVQVSESSFDQNEIRLVTMTAGLDTKVAYIPDDNVNQGFAVNFESTDVIALYVNDGSKTSRILTNGEDAIGSVTPGNPASGATIELNVTGLDPEKTYKWGTYLHSKEGAKPVYPTSGYATVDLSSQPGTLEGAHLYDVIAAGGTNLFTDIASPATFKVKTCLLKLVLSFPETEGTATNIKISGTGVYSKAAFGWGEVAASASTKGDISVADAAIEDGKATVWVAFCPAEISATSLTASVGENNYKFVLTEDAKTLEAGKVYTAARTAETMASYEVADFTGKWTMKAKLFDPNKTLGKGNTAAYTTTLTFSAAEGENGNNIKIKGLYLDSEVEGKVVIAGSSVKIGVYVSSKKIYSAGDGKYCVLLPECSQINTWGKYEFCPSADQAFSSTNYDWLWFDYSAADKTLKYVYANAGQKSENDAYYYCGLSFVTASETEITGSSYDVIYQANYNGSNTEGISLVKKNAELSDFAGDYTFYNYAFNYLSNTTMVNKNGRQAETAVQLVAVDTPSNVNGHSHNMDLVGLYKDFKLPVSLEIAEDGTAVLYTYLSKDFQTLESTEVMAIIPELTNNTTYGSHNFALLSFGPDDCNYCWVGWGVDVKNSRITLGTPEQRKVSDGMWCCGFSCVKEGYAEAAYTTIYQFNYKNQWTFDIEKGGAYFQKK